MTEFTITNTRPEHAQSVYDVVRLAYGTPLDKPCPMCINADDVREQIERFSEGQFVAVTHENDAEIVIGIAATMRTSRPPTAPPLKWIPAIGSKGIAAHEPDGEWLYGVEHCVRPSHQRRGISTTLYKSRFEFVKKLNLRGWYAGGMILGYARYRDQMSEETYAEKVMCGELVDSTVTMQMNRGFDARAYIKDYIEEEEHNNSGILIVWENPDYTP